MAITIFINGRILSPDSEVGFVSTMVVEGDHVTHLGSEHDEAVIGIRGPKSTVNLNNRLVLPGFIDGHVHILSFGLSLQKIDLLPCKSLEEIRKAIMSYAATHTSEPRILCRGWEQSVTNGEAFATVLDDLDPRPIYIEALDLHSTWCNNAALTELNVRSQPDPPGGKIHRYPDGTPSGLLEEAAQFHIIWPFLDRVTPLEKKLFAIDEAISAHRRAGYTGLVDMAMNESDWTVWNLYRNQRGELPMHVAAHWLVPYSESDADICSHIDRAVALHKRFNRTTSPEFCVNGIKLICDGTVDGCTAGLRQPYGGVANIVEPIWPADTLASAIRRATDAGLQCAIHAIGDRTVQRVIDCLSQIPNLPFCRHRIEHLEITTPEDAQRLGHLGIVASVQPVHLDPATFGAWPGLLGPQRCKRAFAYQEFLNGGAHLAFGTDAPTARHFALPNIYIATTRRSALEPALETTINPEFAVSLATAVSAATAGAAYASFADSWTGSLRPGLHADFVVLDMEWVPETLLEARVCQTWYKGKKVFDEEVDGQ
jgi:predicted amidohydrolase YtcJ